MHFLIKWKKNPRLLLTIGMLFCFISVLILQNYSLIKENQRIFEKDNLDSPTLKISDYWNNINFIHINNDNWSSTDVDWIQSRSGTWDDPHIIENITINGGGSGSCILIENSNEFFIIRNCTVYNSGPIYNEDTLQFDAGIKLVNITNGKILNNSCSDTTMGIALLISNNITISNNTVNYNEYGIGFLNSNNTIISRNTVNYNEFIGIQLASSENCNISENNVNENSEGIIIAVSNNVIVSGNSINNNANGINLVLSNNNNITNNTINNNSVGIFLNSGYNNTLSGNNMTECGLVLGANQSEISSHVVDDTNLVNGNPLFCFINEIGLGKDNFTNPGQIILINCSDSLISGFNISHATMGILLYYCVNNSIYNNNLSFCDTAGIGMWFCSNHVISGNSIERSGFLITGTPDSFYSNNFTSNMVNGKDFYYYVNETGLGKDNFTNPGQIFLINCNDSIVSNLNVSYATIGVGMLGKNITISNITASHNFIGVMMGNSYDCIISDNILNDNGWCGMFLDGNWNITIRNNTINENSIGINFVSNCQYNNITENTINNNGRGIQIEMWGSNCENNNISRNTINNNNREGILLQNSNNNTLLENTLNNNKDGLCLKYSNNNTISGNYIQNNVQNGIYFYNCNNNTIYGNNINNNVLQGILLEENCFSNLFHVNYFIKNGIHVIDNLLNTNYWNNSDIGNFWDDYTGKDADNDGIGDIPYYFMDGVDYLPIWESLIPIIPATIDFDPDTLNLKSKGKWVTVYIELPVGHGSDFYIINLDSIRLNGQVCTEPKPIEIGDYDKDGIPDLMVTFNRTVVQDILEISENVEIIISGMLVDGTQFEGTDVIRVV